MFYNFETRREVKGNNLRQVIMILKWEFGYTVGSRSRAIDGKRHNGA